MRCIDGHRHRPHTVRLLCVVSTLSALATGATCPAQNTGCERVYTTDAEFDTGVLFNVNHDVPDQLQLNRIARPFPFVYIACSGRGTIVRIDVNTGAVVGEYLTAPDLMGRDPSRTTVDRLGNVWVSNRAESSVSNGQARGSVTRIGIVLGGTRGTRDANGVFQPDPSGEYLRPPFLYSTCADRDGDGLIRTSRGLGNILPWTNAGSADQHGGVTTAQDECVINYTRIVGTRARTVAIDANNDVWTGGLDNLAHEKLDGATGQPVPGTQFNLGGGGYGGLVDAAGVLWSARGGGGLLRYDPASSSGSVLGNSCGDYGLGVDPQTGNIWHAGLFGGRTFVLSPSGACLGSFAHGHGNAQGVAVDGSGNVWVAHSLVGGGATTVGHLRTDGLFVGNVSLPGGVGPTGVAVDTNGKIWVANYQSNNAMRIDPAAGPVGGGGFTTGAVDMVVDLGGGAQPYNYSDMTGFVAIGTTAQSGTWTVIQDSTVAAQEWRRICWTSVEPAGTSVTVAARAADDPIQLPTLPFVPVTNCQDTCGSGALVGRFIEVRATLARDPNVNDTPILHDLSVACCAGTRCVYTQGYWKNHASAWPVSSLRLGSVGYEAGQLLSILRQPVRGNGLVSLGHQLIAAKLNRANGAAVPPSVATAIQDADAAIGGRIIPPIGTGSVSTASTSGLVGALDRYNNGRTQGGPPHCDANRILASSGYATIGAGCAGSAGVTSLVPLDQPRIGTTFEVLVDPIPDSSALVMTGVSDSTSPLGPLPYDLSPFGMPSCDLLVSPDALFPLHASRPALHALPIPGQASLVGVTLYQQAFVFDRGANNPLRAVVSDATANVIGL